MKNTVQKIVNQLGYRIERKEKPVQTVTRTVYAKEDLLEKFFNSIKEMGFTPQHIIDIGANTGTWSRETLKYFPDSQFTLIEPQEWLSEKFQDLLAMDQVKFFPVGVGNKNDILNFTIHERDDSCSFIYSEEEAKSLGLKQVQIPIKTLNSIIKENNLQIPDLVKIDAEGLDMAVIKGASDLFGKTEVFMIEAGVRNKVYENSILKVLNLMDEAGYELFDITDLNRPFANLPVLWLVELAFVKKGGDLSNYKYNF